MFKKFFSKHDVYLSGLLIALLMVGLITLFSSTRGTDKEVLFIKQSVFVGSGLIFYFIISFLNLNFLKSKYFQIFLYLSLVILLISVLIFTKSVNGASRWFVLPLPFAGSINLQPADLAKIIFILVGSFILTQSHKIYDKKKIFTKIYKYSVFPYMMFLAPILILILLQPALGTTIIIFLTMVFMIYFAAKQKMKVLVFILVPFIIILFWIIFKDLNLIAKILIPLSIITILTLTLFQKISKVVIIVLFILFTSMMFLLQRVETVNFLGNYQRDRVECWLYPERDPIGKCFQQIQAKIAIGSGELFGRGFSQGIQVQQDRLPEFQNDFIYAAFAEQYGFVGTVLLLVAFLLFVSEIFRISTKQNSDFSRVVILGIGTMFLLQIFINISMNNGFLPTTGISLPFMSYGGSFIWIALIAVGLVQNLSHNNILENEKEKKGHFWDSLGED